MDDGAEAAEDYGTQLNLTVWFLTGIAALFLGLRIYAKRVRRRRLWWDDYVLVAGWFSLVLSSAFMSACVHFGLGKHGRFISPDDLPSLLFFSYLAGFFTILSATWTKSSFAITLLSISEGWTRRVVWFMLVSVNLVLGLNALLQWVRCWPVETLWDVGVGVTGYCWFSFAQLRTYNTVSAVYSGTADIAFAVLPWKIIWHAKIRKNEKFGALFAMSIGVLAGITSLLKISSLTAIGSQDMISMVSLFIFATAEGAITTMAASIPILRALFHRNAGPTTPSQPSQF